MSDDGDHHILRLGFWNAQGLTEIDLMAVVETWLSPTDGIPLKRVLVNGMWMGKQRDGKDNGGTSDVVWREGGWCGSAGIDAGGKWTAVKVGLLIIVVGYLPPMSGNGAAARTMLEGFDAFRAGISLQHPASPIVIVGDFNARMGVLTGDVNTVGDNHRKMWMQNWMEDPEWTRLEPSRGKWTTHARNEPYDGK
ncbi:hypothetical protein BC829DRAFT_421176 [Chytridium lagenaria]|nr:hypothetical protein BC829DRAFT_421176 [Chytridium lagenaria]